MISSIRMTKPVPSTGKHYTLILNVVREVKYLRTIYECPFLFLYTEFEIYIPKNQLISIHFA